LYNVEKLICGALGLSQEEKLEKLEKKYEINDTETVWLTI